MGVVLANRVRLPVAGPLGPQATGDHGPVAEAEERRGQCDRGTGQCPGSTGRLSTRQDSLARRRHQQQREDSQPREANRPEHGRQGDRGNGDQGRIDLGASRSPTAHRRKREQGYGHDKHPHECPRERARGQARSRKRQQVDGQPFVCHPQQAGRFGAGREVSEVRFDAGRVHERGRGAERGGDPESQGALPVGSSRLGRAQGQCEQQAKRGRRDQDRAEQEARVRVGPAAHEHRRDQDTRSRRDPSPFEQQPVDDQRSQDAEQVGTQLDEAIGRQRDERHREQAGDPGGTGCTPEQRPAECQDDRNRQHMEDPKSCETQALEQFEEQHFAEPSG